jgi:hypothetical protein
LQNIAGDDSTSSKERRHIMYTLVDFITHIKGIEYILSILAISGFLLFWEALKPRPFRTVIASGKEDLEYIHRIGYGEAMRSIGKLAAAPFIGLTYIVLLPLGFAAAIVIGGTNLMLKGVSSIIGKNMSFDWRPMEAYFTGKKIKK